MVTRLRLLNPIAFPLAVPMLSVPADTRSWPDTVAEPAWPFTVKPGFSSHTPALEEIEYAALVNRLLAYVADPDSLRVPTWGMVRKPTGSLPAAPRTVNGRFT